MYSRPSKEARSLRAEPKQPGAKTCPRTTPSRSARKQNGIHKKPNNTTGIVGAAATRVSLPVSPASAACGTGGHQRAPQSLTALTQKPCDTTRIAKKRRPAKRKLKRVRFANGPLKAPAGGLDGHPTSEGRVAKPVRIIDGAFARGRTVTKKDVRELEQPELLGNEQYSHSLMKLKSRVGLLAAVPPARPYANKASKSSRAGGSSADVGAAIGADVSGAMTEGGAQRRKRSATV